ncbi:hypothetical protein M427DRAFT_51175 [Gonapodya prolifera JEL478]|uniref:peptidyl-tRNA hydrolase n=1 Tax=Gonapodya prolifera (strain JEL478) TaxID=1344416 RepID=A0A139AYI0_GONPJ|nr:hypothetical protein M427DRAFT_51175 [Gonapodya prolifera JEL478]|eukprot:KXS21801.1 hypothetical protein M427DRAFT_51175 [Gonapodya prolifera JEL478]
MSASSLNAPFTLLPPVANSASTSQLPGVIPSVAVVASSLLGLATSLLLPSPTSNPSAASPLAPPPQRASSPILSSNASNADSDSAELVLPSVCESLNPPPGWRPPANVTDAASPAEGRSGNTGRKKPRPGAHLNGRSILAIFVRTDVPMTRGKAAAQCGHAAIAAREAAEKAGKPFPHPVPLLIFRASSEDHMHILRRHSRLATSSVSYTSILDAGRTQLEPGTRTVAALGPTVWEDIVSVLEAAAKDIAEKSGGRNGVWEVWKEY